MDRKLLLKRFEIIVGVLLVVVVVLGILFFAFRSIPTVDQSIENNNGELLPGFPSDPNELIKFLDLNGAKEFTVAGKKVILPNDATISSAYNNTSLSQYVCTDNISSDCTIYEIALGGRTFNISAPLVLRLKETTAISTIKKKLSVSGEDVEFSYTQKKYYNAVLNDQGEVTSSTEVPDLTTVEEIYGCLTSKVCFNSGRLSDDKASNDSDVAAFEQFVESTVVQ